MVARELSYSPLIDAALGNTKEAAYPVTAEYFIQKTFSSLRPRSGGASCAASRTYIVDGYLEACGGMRS